MRYQLWDTLVFPATSRIPLQEFKASCHVIPEPGTLLFVEVDTGTAIGRKSSNRWPQWSLSISTRMLASFRRSRHSFLQCLLVLASVSQSIAGTLPRSADTLSPSASTRMRLCMKLVSTSMESWLGNSGIYPKFMKPNSCALYRTKYFTRTGVHGEWPVVIDTSLGKSTLQRRFDLLELVDIHELIQY